MTIDKQQISVPLLKGVNTVVDPQQEKIGSLTVLRNAKFTKIGSIAKRSGFQTLASSGTLDPKGLVSEWAWDPNQPPSKFEEVGINQALAVRSVNDNIVVVSKDTILKYSKALKALFRAGNYTPLSVGSYPVPESGDIGEFNTQTLVYGNWVYMITHNAYEGQARLTVYDISGREPIIIIKSEPLFLQMANPIFPNSIDGGVTLDYFSIPYDAPWVNACKLLIQGRIQGLK